MKKIVFALLLAEVLSNLCSPRTFAEEVQSNVESYVSFKGGMAKNPETNLEFIARDPLNPALPFPASPVYKSNQSSIYGTVVVNGKEYWGQLEFDLDPGLESKSEDWEATTANPKLYGWRSYRSNPKDPTSSYDGEGWQDDSGTKDAGVVHVPFHFHFEKGQITSDGQELSAIGSKAFYNDEISYVQMWDNRSESDPNGWSVRAIMADWPQTEDGSQKLYGAYLSLPKGVARNEFNTTLSNETVASQLADEKFITKSAQIDARTPSILWQTKSKEELAKEGYSKKQIATLGKGMSTLVWDTSAISLHIPAGYSLKQNVSYKLMVQWSMEKGPLA